MAKKIPIGKKPTNHKATDNVDNWVVASLGNEYSDSVSKNSRNYNDVEEAKPKMKRLTIDVSEELHRAIKMKAVEQGTPMAELLRSLLERNYL